jgi:antitoxin VapB
MNQTAKVFMNGRSQAVRLPIEYRFESDEVFIRKDENTGEVILSEKPNGWSDFIALANSTGENKNFLLDRNDELAQERELF